MYYIEMIFSPVFLLHSQEILAIDDVLKRYFFLVCNNSGCYSTITNLLFSITAYQTVLHCKFISVLSVLTLLH